MRHNGLMDVYRFIAAIIIVADHVVALGIDDFPCARKGHHVIFFFILTGFLTMWHFDRGNDDIWDYTKRKFVRFIPYTVISVVAGNILLFSYDNRIAVVKSLKRAFYSIFEILMLGEIPLVGHSNIIPPLWTLSTMLICFPIVCWFIMKMKNNKAIYWGVIYGSVIGLASLKYYSSAVFPSKLLLGLWCIMTGCILYDVVKQVNKLTVTKCRFYALGGGGIFSFLVTVLICYKCLNELDTFVIMTIISVVLTMSKFGDFIRGNKITDFLGQLSMIVYIIHYNGVWAVQRFFEDYNNYDKIRMYFLIVFIFSIGSYIIVDCWNRKNLSKKGSLST